MSDDRRNKFMGAWGWYVTTSTLIGAPVVFLLVIVGLQKFLATGTCYLGGWRCEYALGAEDSMAQYMGMLLDSNPGVDLVAKPRLKK